MLIYVEKEIYKGERKYRLCYWQQNHDTFYKFWNSQKLWRPHNFYLS